MRSRTLRRSHRLSICLLAMCCSNLPDAAGQPPPTSQRPPNILFLITDDQRWDTIGCMGNAVVQTPHIDRLAAQGTLFSNVFVTASVCSVSRAAMGGRSASRQPLA